MVLNKTFDFMEKNTKPLKEYIKPAIDIKEIKAEWNEKMKKREQEGYRKKEYILIMKPLNITILSGFKNKMVPSQNLKR